jgi:hypothetical protein
MVRPSTRIAVLATLCLLVVGTASSLGSDVALANSKANAKDGCDRKQGETQGVVLTVQRTHQGIPSIDSVSTIDSFSSGKCQNDGNTNACILNVGNTHKDGGRVKATTSISCKERADFIHVEAWVSRRNADGVIVAQAANQNGCVLAKSCSVTASLDWKDFPNDQWHGWGKGRVEYDNQGAEEDKCQFRGSFTAFGVTGLFRSEECRQHNRCRAL